MGREKSESFFLRNFGDRTFVRSVFAIAVPIMVQNGITNFVSLLDNIMIGRVGTEQMSGASIVNQLLFVFNLMIFGGLSGAGIFTAQYYGQKNKEGIAQTFRFKLYLGIVLTGLAAILFLSGGKTLIGLYLTGEGGEAERAATLSYALGYLRIMLWGLVPFMLVQVLASTLRECGQTFIPMRAGIIAVLVNLVFNYLLIYGKLGFPALGVWGAALATVLSRFVELLVVLLALARRIDRFPYMQHLFSSYGISLHLVKRIILMGSPLLLNETLWAAGVAFLSQCYSVKGLDVVASTNISNTITNLFRVVLISMGSTVAILVGQKLGAGKMEDAKRTARRLIVLSVVSCMVVMLLMLPLGPLFPMLYNTTSSVRALATAFITVAALMMPIEAFLNASYFILRAGGRTVITFLFDSAFIWVVSASTAFVLTRYTALSAVAVYAIVSSADLLKCIVGFILVKKGVWLRNIVAS